MSNKYPIPKTFKLTRYIYCNFCPLRSYTLKAADFNFKDGRMISYVTKY